MQDHWREVVMPWPWWNRVLCEITRPYKRLAGLPLDSAVAIVWSVQANVFPSPRKDEVLLDVIPAKVYYVAQALLQDALAARGDGTTYRGLEYLWDRKLCDELVKAIRPQMEQYVNPDGSLTPQGEALYTMLELSGHS